MLKTVHVDRRAFVKAAILVSGLAASSPGSALFAQEAVGAPLPLKREGEMDIHHIDTGRGNSALVIGPDGRALMIDAGDSRGPVETSSRPRPDGSHRAGEAQASYALRYVPAGKLDHFVATHIHPDHIGAVDETNPTAAVGDYKLTGVSDVDRLVPIGTVIDRGYPDYRELPARAPFAANYLAYLKSRTALGRAVQQAHVGSDQQIKLADAKLYPLCRVRILAGNGDVWTGRGEASASRLSARLPREQAPENILSVALRIQYGRFSYFSGGDLNCDTHDGQSPWMDVETPVTRVAGRTEVALADHHGYFDACGPEFVRNLNAQVYIIPAWDVGHPGPAQMQRMMGMWGEKATHDVFMTDLLPDNARLNRRFVPQLKNRQGHVVVRVAAGGGSYQVFVVDSTVEAGNVTGVFGPYQCRA